MLAVAAAKGVLSPIAFPAASQLRLLHPVVTAAPHATVHPFRLHVRQQHSSPPVALAAAAAAAAMP
jgi:hypothetical protein